MNEHRITAIQSAIQAALAPAHLEVIDDSHLHAGHAGAKDGRGHFRVTVTATAFAGKSALQRHKMVYAAVGSLMQTDIHALSVTALTPDE